MPVWGSALVVVALIVVEAVFVASEMALVTLREGQVRALADSGRRGAKVAHLVENPNRFLSAVQIGVTTTALLSSAFGAVTLSDSMAHGLEDAGLGKGSAQVLGFLIVTLIIAYVTLVVGELAPKRVALQRAESTASAVGPTLDRFARLMRPVIWLLSASTDVLYIPVPPASRTPVWSHCSGSRTESPGTASVTYAFALIFGPLANANGLKSQFLNRSSLSVPSR